MPLLQEGGGAKKEFPKENLAIDKERRFSVLLSMIWPNSVFPIPETAYLPKVF